MPRLLTVLELEPYIDPTPPTTFAGITSRIFPPVSAHGRHGPPVPECNFSFSLRELVDEGFVIEATTKILDHLVISGQTVQILTLTRLQLTQLVYYENNTVAQ